MGTRLKRIHKACSTVATRLLARSETFLVSVFGHKVSDIALFWKVLEIFTGSHSIVGLLYYFSLIVPV